MVELANLATVRVSIESPKGDIDYCIEVPVGRAGTDEQIKQALELALMKISVNEPRFKPAKGPKIPPMNK